MFTNPEMYYNNCQNCYERKHIYIPDLVGYADGRISIQVDNDNVEYFPDSDVWRFNKSKVFGVYEIFDKLELSDEEPLFWACIKKSVGSEKCNFNWPELLCQSLDFSDDSFDNSTFYLEESDRPSCKKYKEALKPLIGEVIYTGTDRKNHIYKSEKYGVIKMSKEISYGKRTLVFEKGDKFPKTVELLRKHPLFIGE